MTFKNVLNNVLQKIRKNDFEIFIHNFSGTINNRAKKTP